MALPPESCTRQDMVVKVFGEGRWDDPDWLLERAILTPLVSHVDELNAEMCASFPREVRVYTSADRAEGDHEDFGGVPEEFLNTLSPSGLPPHQLPLKLGMPVMLICNINRDQGQVNGTRAIIRGLFNTVPDLELLGEQRGLRVFVPRMNLYPSDTDLSFKLRRRQFPLRPAFAMTINKTQGQSLEFMGLPAPVFSHGQL